VNSGDFSLTKGVHVFPVSPKKEKHNAEPPPQIGLFSSRKLVCKKCLSCGAPGFLRFGGDQLEHQAIKEGA